MSLAVKGEGDRLIAFRFTLQKTKVNGSTIRGVSRVTDEIIVIPSRITNALQVYLTVLHFLPL